LNTGRTSTIELWGIKKEKQKGASGRGRYLMICRDLFRQDGHKKKLRVVGWTYVMTEETDCPARVQVCKNYKKLLVC